MVGWGIVVPCARYGCGVCNLGEVARRTIWLDVVRRWGIVSVAMAVVRLIGNLNSGLFIYLREQDTVRRTIILYPVFLIVKMLGNYGEI